MHSLPDIILLTAGGARPTNAQFDPAGMARSYGCPTKSFSDTCEIIVVFNVIWNKT
jgi:hypothetical protein